MGCAKSATCMVAAGSAIAATVPGLTDLEPPSDAGRMPQDGSFTSSDMTRPATSPNAEVMDVADGGDQESWRPGQAGCSFSRLSQGLAFGLWWRARVGAPHRGRTTPVDERARIRRNPDPLPADAWAEYCGHRGLRWIEAAGGDWGNHGSGGFHSIPVDGGVVVRWPGSS